MIKNELAIAYRKICDLRPYPNALRIHTRSQRRKAKSLLRRFGQVAPIIIDFQGVIVDGHLIFDEAKALGYDEVATITVDRRNEAEVRALRLALNRLPQDSKWDNARLRAEFEELLEITFDFSLTGFDQVEIDMVLSLEEPTSAGVEDAPPVMDPNAIPVSRDGDVWLMNAHRLICGDARKPQVLAKLVGDASAQMVFTDPPYNVKIEGHVSGLGGTKHREFAMASGELSRVQFIEFLMSSVSALLPGLQSGGLLYICMDWRHLCDLQSAVEQLGLTPMNLSVWAKTNAGMGTFYRSQHELVYVVKKGAEPHINNFELGKKGRSRTNVWHYSGMNVVGRGRDDLLKLHPTVKPVALVADAIRDVSHRNGIVLDPFLGSGTTLIAAQDTGRRCFGVEYDALYVDLAVRRWMDHTGGIATLAETGETFEQREERVRFLQSGGALEACRDEEC